MTERERRKFVINFSRRFNFIQSSQSDGKKAMYLHYVVRISICFLQYLPVLFSPLFIFPFYKQNIIAHQKSTNDQKYYMCNLNHLLLLTLMGSSQNDFSVEIFFQIALSGAEVDNLSGPHIFLHLISIYIFKT